MLTDLLDLSPEHSRPGDSADIDTADARARALLEMFPVPVTVSRLSDGLLFYCNRRAEDLLEIGGVDWHDIQSTRFYANHDDRAEMVRELLIAGRVTDKDMRFRSWSGREFWAHLSAQRCRFGDDEALIVSFHDVDQQRLLAEATRSREAFLRGLFDALPIAVLQTDRQGRIEFINNASQALFGLSLHEFRRRDWWRTLFPDKDYRAFASEHLTRLMDQARQRRSRMEVGANGSSDRMELKAVCYHPRREERDLEFLYVDMDSHGLWTLVDVTEQNQAERSLLAANLDLQQQLAENQRLQEQLREQAVRDPLTGLFNRRYLDDILDGELARARRQGYPVAVVMLDIDHFKRLNDTYGHQAGDEVIRRLGGTLRRNSRSGDLLCRYGGEEFILVLPNMGQDDALVRCEALRRSFASEPVRFGRQELSATLSGGLALFPFHGEDRDQLIRAADGALYAAKAAGRNRLRLADAPLASVESDCGDGMLPC
ncbi:diguanylate cyclase [Oryzomicrobium sp.]|uniref:sensor domain-containing diguanylate cyclase n=1 Tax=Oryzomicrobium sp. TaxID=1911578 RepID=UPI0025CD2519|nr:diguanylate cyclase [Oryzomicrobium sp.]MCE1242597.1 diguanylate cyclase [Oryzomicrobium sp.]